MADPADRSRGEGAAASGAVYHGGALAQVRAAFPDAPEPWIDLSTGINPIPYPIPALDPEDWTRLPEPARVTGLEAVAAGAFGVADPRRVVATPGTQAAIEMLPRLFPGERIAILGFTYQEHGHTWRKAGRSVEAIADPADLAAADVGVVVNPNNPDGRRFSVAELAALAARSRATGSTLIVDEAFMDGEPEPESLAPLSPPGVVVLRSFGKTWGLAGLRLGFVVAEPATADRFRTAFGPWAVSGPAISIGAAALADGDWLAATRRRLAADAARLDRLLAGAGFRSLGGTSLFRLVGHDRATAIADRLAAAGIHVRRFPHDPRLLRFGLPGAESAWQRLLVALTAESPVRS
jgi:cobalamin biosynthetic protein CobC